MVFFNISNYLGIFIKISPKISFIFDINNIVCYATTLL